MLMRMVASGTRNGSLLPLRTGRSLRQSGCGRDGFRRVGSWRIGWPCVQSHSGVTNSLILDEAASDVLKVHPTPSIEIMNRFTRREMRADSHLFGKGAS